MFQVTQLFLLKIFFVIEILIAIFLFSFKLKKRSYPTIRYLISIVVCVLIAVFYPVFEELSYTWWYSSLMFLGLFASCMGTMFFIYDVPWQRIFFISITAYTIQHFSHEIYTLVETFLGFSSASELGMYGGEAINLATDLLPFLFCFVTYLVVYSIFFVLMEKKIDQFNVNVHTNSILFLSTIILLTDILLNSFTIYFDEYNRDYAIIVCIYNLLCCCLIFYIQIKIILSQKMQNELQITSQLLHKAKEQYKESRENIDLINLKVHDLKHQIREFATKSKVSQETIEDMENIINIYDSTMQTGNDVLDLILTEKSLYCKKRDILLTCLADCSKLSFMKEADIYSLFGNMIDNAVEAVSKIVDKEKRGINLIVRNVNKYISINISNFFEGEIVFGNDGLPITTKTNKDYHGYGMKSIKLIVNKYSGDFKITTENGIFSIFILFAVE